MDLERKQKIDTLAGLVDDQKGVRETTAAIDANAADAHNLVAAHPEIQAAAIAENEARKQTPES